MARPGVGNRAPAGSVPFHGADHVPDHVRDSYPTTYLTRT